MTIKKENAVSPVVGVMLMLVVTIIIAAVVASFASGLGSSTEANPVVTMSADASRTSGLLITFTGISSGSLNVDDISILVSKVDSNDYYEIPYDKFTPLGLDAFEHEDKIKVGDVLALNQTVHTEVITDLGDTATKPSYLTSADVYNIFGEKISVRIANKNGVLGTVVTRIKA